MSPRRSRCADPKAGSEPRSPLSLDALIAETARTARAVHALSPMDDPGKDEAHLTAREVACRELTSRVDTSLTPYAMARTLRRRLDALMAAASFEPATTARQGLFQVILAVSCIQIAGMPDFRNALSPDEREEVESQLDKAERLLYSAVEALAQGADADLATIRERFCATLDAPLAATDQILSAF